MQSFGAPSESDWGESMYVAATDDVSGFTEGVSHYDPPYAWPRSPPRSTLNNNAPEFVPLTTQSWGGATYNNNGWSWGSASYTADAGDSFTLYGQMGHGSYNEGIPTAPLFHSGMQQHVPTTRDLDASYLDLTQHVATLHNLAAERNSESYYGVGPGQSASAMQQCASGQTLQNTVANPKPESPQNAVANPKPKSAKKQSAVAQVKTPSHVFNKHKTGVPNTQANSQASFTQLCPNPLMPIRRRWGTGEYEEKGGDKNVPCRFFARGNCVKGKYCEWAHEYTLLFFVPSLCFHLFVSRSSLSFEKTSECCVNNRSWFPQRVGQPCPWFPQRVGQPCTEICTAKTRLRIDDWDPDWRDARGGLCLP